MEIRINNISYFVEIHQQNKNKENLFLLHGFMGSGCVFDLMIPQLKSFCNPITIDLLGHGKTGNAGSPRRFHFQNQVDDLAAVISEITYEPIYLHGYSMGGRLALNFALAKANLLKGLILESTNPGLNDKQELVHRKRLDDKRASEIETNFHSFLDKWSVLPLFNNEISDKDHLNRYHEIQRKQNPQQMAYSLRGFGTGWMPPVYKQLQKLDMPVLLLVGEKDKKYVKIMKGMNRRFSKSRLKMISKAGHRIHVDQSDDMTTKLKTFIKPI